MTAKAARSKDPSCCRKRRAVDDPFYSRCNRIAFYSGDPHCSSAETILYIEERQEQPVDYSMMMMMDMTVDRVDANTLESEPTSTSLSPSTNTTLPVLPAPRFAYPCCVPGCTRSFPTMVDAETHFEESHMYQCAVCHDFFSCNHLLELHLQETHDSFFCVRVERQQLQCHRDNDSPPLLFACLVESCDAVFCTRQERHVHLTTRHSYPKWFRFQSSRVVPRDQGKTLQKKQRWMQHHKQHSERSPPTSASTATTTTSSTPGNNKMQVDHSNGETIVRTREQKEKRRERQKKKRATIPCRYYMSNEGCWRGESCMFLHASPEQQSKNKADTGEQKNGDDGGGGGVDLNNENGDDNDVCMTTLVDDMTQKAKVSVPDKISFGRRGRRKGPY